MATECAKCKKASADLKMCAKCRGISYCSRDCQKDDWEVHKKSCVKKVQDCTSQTQRKGLDADKAKPFTALYNRAWLHNRSEKDTCRVLIDSYRLKMADDALYDGGCEKDAFTLLGLRRYLNAAKARGDLLPPWWSINKQAECEALASGGDVWYNLRVKPSKSQFNDYYGDGQFAMQLRLIREQITGRGPGGQPGASIIRLQMVMERRGMRSSVVDATTGRIS
ncbi:hypothetical protein BJ166DRAFT_595514 [Pestalotiopsis sp. NC0098]|nr:hypothetical protein BJ166DRAFT_595514 [Pestalotiopsis sp. NC0098]